MEKRNLTDFEINTIEFDKMPISTSINIEKTDKYKTKYQFTIELKRISFKCDKNFIGVCNDSDGNQKGYAIVLKKDDLSVDAYFITQCSESEAFIALNDYAAGFVYVYHHI